MDLFSLPQHLQFLCPHNVAEKLSGQVEHRGGRNHDNKENDAQGSWKDVQHRIDPDSRDVFDNVQPHQVTSHEDRESRDSCLATGILTERREQLQEDKDHNVCVQDVVQPATKERHI